MKLKFELFGRLKKHPKPAMQQKPVPIQRVHELSAEGWSEADIIKRLKEEGYSFGEIDSALNQAISSNIAKDRNVLLAGIPSTDIMPQSNVETPQPIAQEQYQTQLTQQLDYESIEPWIEAVVEERLAYFKGVQDKINQDLLNVAEEINNLDKSLRVIENKNDDDLVTMHKQIGDLVARVESIEPQIESLEKAFKDTIPNLVDSIRQVMQIIKEMKGGPSAVVEGIDETKEFDNPLKTKTKKIEDQEIEEEEENF